MIPTITYGGDFSGIVEYLTVHRDHDVLGLRGVSTIAMAAEEMALTAALSVRVKSPVAHLSLSAAIEDGVLDCSAWMNIADATEAELGLVGHQRVVVRHRDKGYDHIHAFWCTVSQDSGQTPERRWFLAKGATNIGVGALALMAEQVEDVPADQRVWSSWNHRALIRLQQLCRTLEKELGLRQLRAPREIAAAREQGEARTADAQRTHREERTGARRLIELAVQIRGALDASTWQETWRMLGQIGVGLEPAFRTSKAHGQSVSGLVVYDLSDPGNRVPASQFDMPGRKYGLRQIEKRRSDGALTIDEWWPERGLASFNIDRSQRDDRQRLRDQYDLIRQRHSATERDKAVLRRKLAARHLRERKAKAKSLMQERRAIAMTLPVDQRRAFYSIFSRFVRLQEMTAMAKAHAEEAAPLRRSRTVTWKDFRLARERKAADTMSSVQYERAKAPLVGGRSASADEHVTQQAKPVPPHGQANRGENMPASPESDGTADDVDLAAAYRSSRSNTGR